MKEKLLINWKKLFISLAILNGIIVLLLIVFILWPVPNASYPSKEYIEEDPGAEFTIQSSKENLTELVNAYIDKLLKDKNDKYAVSFDDQVHLMGAIEAFSTEVPVSITFDPKVQDNGDIILKASEMSLGLLRLPKDKILKYVNERVYTPDWVTIHPKEESIYLALTKMELKSNFRVRAQQFDLENDRITFRFKVPNETLGL
ncbi:YpmS family protein [Gracilibacillus dipsosauri]|uniref:YpmS family protein n=1 Tax=Gracilibacillus dipsosauri TaxID=178340 RepID=UPI0024092E64